MRKFFIIITILFSQMSCSVIKTKNNSTVNSNTYITEETKYYDIEGTTLKNLLLDMNKKTPVDGGFNAETNNYLHWYWYYKEETNNCSIKKVKGEVNIIYTMPKLSKKTIQSNINKNWQKWYDVLTKHEKQHGQHAIDISRFGNAQILKATKNNCQELDKYISSSLIPKFIKKLNKLDAEYDIKTNHGTTEGATLYSYFKTAK